MSDTDAFEWVVRYRVEGDLDDLASHLSTLSPIDAAILMLGIAPRLSSAELERVENELQQAALAAARGLPKGQA